MKRFWLRMGFGMSLVTILSGIGFAGQQGTVARGAASTGVIELEEVVVTATKIEQKISDLPVSASVITRDEMEKKR
ncbi:MAG: hypothetical protein ABIG09_08080, partial [bacterium]